MGLRINTNVQSIAAQRSLRTTNKQRSRVLGQLSSGSRIVSAADDAAGLAISEKLKSSIRSLRQANRNANDGISLIQTAEGGLNEISSILVRLRELGIQSASDTVGDTERQFSDLEFQNLKEEVNRISKVTEYNGRKLLSGDGETLEIQIGMRNNPEEDRVTYDSSVLNSSLDGLGIAGLDVMSKGGAQEGLETLDLALTNVSRQRAILGAKQNRLNSTSNGIQITTENLSAANSRIRDTDYAEASSENVKASILNNAGTSVLAQANGVGQSVLKLIG